VIGVLEDRRHADQTHQRADPLASPQVIPEPIRPRNPASRVPAKLVSALRGDKYMIGAYPPAGRGAAPDAEPSTTPAMSGTKGR
jgi:hypothetical protein